MKAPAQNIIKPAWAAWAAPAVRKVNAIMQQRGLGASSMAAAAITQALYESALPIAAQDAKSTKVSK